METEYCEICGENIKSKIYFELGYCDACWYAYLYQVAKDYLIPTNNIQEF